MENNSRANFRKKIGQVPGAIIYTGRKHEQQLFMESFDFNKDSCSEKELKTIEDAFEFKTSDSTTWLNINGLSHVNEIEKIGSYYNLHPLVLEDIVNIAQRPKMDEYENYLFVVIKMLYYDNAQKVVSEQVSFVLGKNYVISFQEAEGDVFEEIRDRIRSGKGRIRSMSADYLLYSLIDAVVDHYFNIIETLGDKIEDLESDLFADKLGDDLSRQVQEMKREILKVRRAIFPLREVISRIDKLENDLIGKKIKNYYRDIYDHIIQVNENVEIYREMIWSLMDMYMTTISNKMNEVMKVLTIMATIFIPLTFIAGIYGMNFDNIPELHYKYSYYILWGVMVIIVIFMFLYFKRKKWL
ncbi:MAG: magnesium/cobalt transporter CorA [Bacteroidia bacterium]|nr:magnesium/cobalt transporter CorA [Bacteroidia bacterium]NND51610.1 magnesium/cobalt transporter CorA [Flavobacteriaceae bacterium]